MRVALIPFVMLFSGCLSTAAPASDPRTVTVTTQEGLIAAIARAQSGDQIMLGTGNYGDVDIRGKLWTADVTLVSATPANPARFDSITVNDVSHLALKSIHIGRALKAGEPDYFIIGNFRDVASVTLEDVFVRGSLDGNAANDGNGLNFVDSRDVTIKGSRFEQLGRGTQMSGSTNLRLIDNVFRNMRSDGMNFANVQNVTIDNNLFSDFMVGEGDHPDAIQFWTAGTTRASTGIVIRNNQILQGSGAGTQGIFLTDQVGTLPYQNVRIENNLLYVYDGYNGIMVGNGRQIEIIGNSILSEPGDDQKYWIRLEDVEGATVQNNIADSFVNQNNRALNMVDNVFLDQKSGLASRIRDLRAQANATAAGLIVAGQGYQLPAR